MTISSATNKIAYVGSGTVGPFPIPFYFINNSDLLVVKTTIADGTNATLTEVTDYTVTGAGSLLGGTLTLIAALAATHRLTIVRDPAQTQEHDYIRMSKFPADAHELGLDRLTMLVQRTREIAERGIRLPEADQSWPVLPQKSLRANGVVGFDANGIPAILPNVPSNGPFSALNVNYLAPGLGGVNRTVANMFDDLLTVENYGADATGVADSTASFQAALNQGKRIRVPRGTYLILGTLTFPEGSGLIGDGVGATLITTTTHNAAVFNVATLKCEIAHMKIIKSGGAAVINGSKAINFTVAAGDPVSFHFHDLLIQGFYLGIEINSPAIGILERIKVTNCGAGGGIKGTSAQGYWTEIDLISNIGNGITLVGGGGVPPWMVGIHSYANGGWDIHCTGSIHLLQAYLNNSSQGNLYITGAGSDSGYIAHARFEYAGENPNSADPNYPDVLTAPAIKIENAGPIEIHDFHIFNPNGIGIDVGGSLNCIFNGGRILGAGVGGVALNGFSIIGRAGSAGIFVNNVYANTGMEFGDGFTKVLGSSIIINSVTPCLKFVTLTTNQMVDNCFIQNSGGQTLFADVGCTLVWGAANIVGVGAVNDLSNRIGTHLCDYNMSPAPVVTPGSGAFTTVSATLTYTKDKNRTHFQCRIANDNNGTAGTNIAFTLPYNAVEVTSVIVVDQLTGIAGVGIIGAGTNSCSFRKYDGTYLGGTGSVYVITGTFRHA